MIKYNDTIINEETARVYLKLENNSERPIKIWSDNLLHMKGYYPNSQNNYSINTKEILEHSDVNPIALPHTIQLQPGQAKDLNFCLIGYLPRKGIIKIQFFSEIQNEKNEKKIITTDWIELFMKYSYAEMRNELQ